MSTKYQTGGKQIRCLSALRIEGMKPPEEWRQGMTIEKLVAASAAT